MLWQNATFLDHVMQGLVWTLGSEKTLAFSYNGKIGNATRAAPSTSASASSLAVASEARSVVFFSHQRRLEKTCD
jgi:hypothetical protein